MQRHHVLSDPPLAESLFNSTSSAWIWLVVRVYIGYEWLMAGLHKVGAPGWTGENPGAAVAGFTNGALAKAAGENPAVQGWYAAFLEGFVLPNAGVFAYLVAYGEVVVGLALIAGMFTGIAAFFGSVMNFNYLLAGTVSTNPIMFAAATLLVLSWKVAGWYGVDRWLLPALGAPWEPGRLFRDRYQDNQGNQESAA